MFYQKIWDYQVERIITNQDYAIINAEHVTAYGFETGFNWSFLPDTWLQGTLGYTHAKFDVYNDPATDTDYSGNYVPYMPDFTGHLSLSYQPEQGFYGRVESNWVGKIFFDDLNSPIGQENDYMLLNVRAGWKQKNYSMQLFVENIADHRYYTTRFIPSRHGVPGSPRTIGVRVAYQLP